MAHEVTLHVAFVHSFVNPALFLVLHRSDICIDVGIHLCVGLIHLRMPNLT
jgi:hypothetical protein